MPKSRVWPSQLPTGTPVMVHYDARNGLGDSLPQRVAGTIVKIGEVTKGRIRADGRWRYLVQTSRLGADGFALAHWWPERAVHPVDVDDHEQLLEWLDG